MITLVLFVVFRRAAAVHVKAVVLTFFYDTDAVIHNGNIEQLFLVAQDFLEVPEIRIESDIAHVFYL